MPKGTGRTQTITIRVGPRLRSQIEEYASAREMSVGEFVRYCVLVYMDTTPAEEEK